MIDLIAAAGIGGIIGFGVGFVWKRQQLKRAAYWLRHSDEHVTHWWQEWKNVKAAHARCADALTTTQRKLSAIRDLLDTPRTIRKGELAAVLDGDA